MTTNIETKAPHISVLTREYLDSAPTEQSAIEGWRDFNRALGGGFSKSSLNVVCAKSGFGKTNYLVWLALQLLQSGEEIIFASVELTREKILERFLASILGVNYNSIKKIKNDNPEKIERLIESFERSYPIRFVFAETIEELYETVAEVRMQKGENGKNKYDYLLLDHIHELETKKIFRFDLEKMRYIVALLEKMYKSSGMAVITAAQFVKGMEKGSDFGERTLDDIAGSSVIRNKCSNIIYLFETEEQQKHNGIMISNGKPNLCQCSLKLLKARDGFGDWKTTMYYDRGKVLFTLQAYDQTFGI